MIAKVNETSLRYIGQYSTSKTNISVKRLDNEDEDENEKVKKKSTMLTVELKDDKFYRDIPLIDFI